MHNLWVFYYFFSKITFYLKLFSDCCDQFGYRGPLYTCLVLYLFFYLSEGHVSQGLLVGQKLYNSRIAVMIILIFCTRIWRKILQEN